MDDPRQQALQGTTASPVTLPVLCSAILGPEVAVVRRGSEVNRMTCDWVKISNTPDMSVRPRWGAVPAWTAEKFPAWTSQWRHCISILAFIFFNVCSFVFLFESGSLYIALAGLDCRDPLASPPSANTPGRARLTNTVSASQSQRVSRHRREPGGRSEQADGLGMASSEAPRTQPKVTAP